jgi:hypothetical protein
MLEVRTELLFDLKADVDWAGAVDVGNTPHGMRRIFYVTGGTLDGPKIRGTVLPGGGDWCIVRPDGAIVLDVRVAFCTDDGHAIHAYYRGLSTIQIDLLGRILVGEAMHPSEYYFRTTPVFETASEKYGWLNRVLAVGIGQFLPTGVAYKVYAIL